jgi:lysozyme
VDLDALRQQLIHDEGLRLKAYRDTVGKLTIGVGRNLDDKGISEAEAAVLLENDIDEHVALLDAKLPWWRKLDEARQNALANMCFNMGVGQEDPPHGLLGFKNSLALLERGEYEKAAANLAMSKWAKQVGPRATRIIAVIKGQPNVV